MKIKIYNAHYNMHKVTCYNFSCLDDTSRDFKVCQHGGNKLEVN